VIFNVLLAVVLLIGLLFPGPGTEIAEWRRHLVIAVMFLMSVTLPAERLRAALGNVRGLGASFGVGYVVLPILCGLLGLGLYGDEPGPFAGMVILGALPCTLASATVWTRMAGGDDALALTYTVLSNLASVLLVPAYLLLFLGSSLEVPAARLLTDLAIVVLAPVVAGQFVRRVLGPRADSAKPAISVIARGLVLTIVLVAVSNMSDEIRAEPAVVGELAALGAVVHIAALALGHQVSGRLGGLRDERIAVGFAGSQKTLFIGVFLAGEYFPDAPLALLPITAYHVLQLVIDTAVAGRLARPTAAAETEPAR
jgi:sodium/bile acid cotransporter 7